MKVKKINHKRLQKIMLENHTKEEIKEIAKTETLRLLAWNDAEKTKKEREEKERIQESKDIKTALILIGLWFVFCFASLIGIGMFISDPIYSGITGVVIIIWVAISVKISYMIGRTK